MPENQPHYHMSVFSKGKALEEDSCIGEDGDVMQELDEVFHKMHRPGDRIIIVRVVKGINTSNPDACEFDDADTGTYDYWPVEPETGV